MDFGFKSLEIYGRLELNLDINDDNIEVINLSGEHIFVEIKYRLHDDDKYNIYKNNVLDDINGFQFLSDDGQWYNYPY